MLLEALLQAVLKIGKNCTLAGCCAVVDNVEIADEVHITAMTLITKSIKKPGVYSSGTPFMENKRLEKECCPIQKNLIK